MNTDPIADLLTRIRNAQNAEHSVVSVPHSKIKEEILRVMKEKGFINAYKTEGEIKKNLTVELNEEKELTLRRVSKPGQRIYLKNNELEVVKSGLGISIVSTSKGIMTNAQAKKQKLGGEVICEIY